MEYISYGFSNYFNFSGRATRKQFWLFMLFIFVGSLLCVFLDSLFSTFALFGDYGLLSGIFALACFFPNLTISVRRLHDIGRSGFWLFINLVPIIGGIILLIFFCTSSDPGLNKYGAPDGFIPLDYNR